MPLLDHFHAPLEERYPWDSFHSGWATRIADQLSERVPAEFLVAEHTHSGNHLEIDVATFEHDGTQLLHAVTAFSDLRLCLFLRLRFPGSRATRPRLGQRAAVPFPSSAVARKRGGRRTLLACSKA